ncbi:MAG: hypothetical protein Tsb009_04680 [Planctomycetaceae bacterium]
MNRLFSMVLIAGMALSGSFASPVMGIAYGQPAANGTLKGEVTTGTGARLFDHDPEIKRLIRMFRQAKKLAKQGDYTLCFRMLEMILDYKKDALFSLDIDKNRELVSLKTEALRLIGNLPKKGRDAYELKYGFKAKQLLSEAIQNADIQKIESIARRYFHTEAGYKATYLMGTYQMDRANPLAAALEFSRLRKLPTVARRLKLEPMLSLKNAVCWGRAGLPKLSVQTLAELKKNTPGNSITIRGRRVRLFDDERESLEWLVATLGSLEEFQQLGNEKWTMFRGNASRTAISSKASPVWDSLWTKTTVLNQALLSESPEDFKRVQSHLEDIARKRAEKKLLRLPAAHPLIVGDLVIARSVRAIVGYHLKTGELVWMSAIDDPDFKKYYTKTTSNSSSSNSPLDMLLEQRGWRDMTAGTLSSDGKYVYSVEELGFINPTNPNLYSSRFRSGTRPSIEENLPSYNTLAAYEADSGLLKWNIGGPAGDKSLLLGGAFFLGPPLPIGGHLYCLIEHQGSIQLAVLEPQEKNANLLWMQPLVNPASRNTIMTPRRMAGLSPSYDGGVLVCPTAAGAVVAMDPARRMLLWGYTYSVKQNESNSQHNNPFAFRGRGAPSKVIANDAEGRWIGSTPTIADGRVILTPSDSDELHCVSLIDGSLLWKQAREDGLFVAAVHKGNVIIVGKSMVKALKLSDGTLAWKQPTELESPSGRGFQTQGYYHLPVVSAESSSVGEIATIDLTSGRIVARSRTRSGRVLGNLVSAGGEIVSQSYDRLIGFKPYHQLKKEIDAQMQANPNNPLTLAMRGEMRLHSGEEDAGLADLRRSIALKPSPRAQSLVVASLLEGLRVDFAGYRKYSPEIERLLHDPEQRSRYLRYYAAGLHEVGEHRKAFSKYLQLAGPDTGALRDIRAQGSLVVRSDRWVQSRIKDIFQEATQKQRVGLNAEIEAQYALALKANSPDAMRKFLQYFSSLPKGIEARRNLVKQLGPNRASLEKEFLLNPLMKSSDPKIAGYATANLAKVFLEAKRYEDVLPFIQHLEGRFGNVVCQDGKTGREVAMTLKKTPEIAAAISAQTPWPAKRLLSARKTNFQSSRTAVYNVPVEGPRGPYFRNWTFKLDTRSRTILGLDGQGRRRWSFPIGTGSHSSYYGNSIRIHGHLLVVTLANRFLVVDTLVPAGSPRILWSRNLYETPPGTVVNRGVAIRAVRMIGGRQQFIIPGPQGQVLGNIGPITDEMLVYQSDKTIYAADLLTGKNLWKRQVSHPGYHLFGDANHIFAVSPQSPTQAILLRGIDGVKVGERTMISVESQIATNGPHVLTWRLSGNNYLLTYTNVFTEKVLWQKQFASDAKLDLIKNQEVGIVEPTLGRFAVLDIPTGKTRVDEKIPPEPGLNHIVVHRSANRYVLLSYSPRHVAKKANNGRIMAFIYTNPMVNGLVHGFSRKTGKRIWTTKIEQQSFEFGQADNLPVLVLASRIYIPSIRRAGIRQSSHYRLSIEILDTRNGQHVFAYEGNQSISSYPFTVAVNPDKKSIDVDFYRMGVTLNTSEKELGPAIQYADPPPKQNSQKPGAKPVKKVGGLAPPAVAPGIQVLPAAPRVIRKK